MARGPLAVTIHDMSLLWFRRSRRQEAKPGAPQPEQKAAAARPPLRIRGLLLLNLQPTDGLDQIETAPPLGPRQSVIAAIQRAAPGLVFDANGRGLLTAGDHRVTIEVGPADPVHAAVASAEGDRGVEILKTVIQAQRWRAYAPRAGVFIEPDALNLFALPDAAPPAPR